MSRKKKHTPKANNVLPAQSEENAVSFDAEQDFVREPSDESDAESEVSYSDAEPISVSCDLFLDSLETLSSDDIAPAPQSNSSAKRRIFPIIRYTALVVFAAIFIGSGWSLVQRLADYKKGDDIYGNIADNIFSEDLSGEHAIAPSTPLSKSPVLLDYYTSLSSDASDITSDTVEHNAKFEQIKANLNYLKSVNPDIYGYIHIDGTNISFPIVQGEDNEYYLNRAWNGDFLVVGSIYADYRADANIENNRNTVFYGHNMLDGNMFNNVMLFRDEEIFNSKLIEVYTFDGMYTYEPFSIFQTVYTYQYFRMEFSSDEDFVAFCEEMQSQSEHNKNMTFTGDDKIITLSTCTPSNDASSYYVGRIALHAKLIKVEK